jgi:hypothetical protein
LFRYVVLFLVAALFTSCTLALPVSEKYSVHIDPSTSIDQQALILKALDSWQESVGVEFQIDIGGCELGVYQVCIKTVSSAEMKEITGENGVFGFTDRRWFDQSSKTYIVETLGVPQFSWAITHELGHTMGLQHTEAETVMYYWWGNDVSETITCADRQQYYALRGAHIECAESYHLTGQ